MASLAGIATAVPPFVLEQAEIRDRVHAQFSNSAVVNRLLPVFESAGIHRRYSCVPVDWYYGAHGWSDRNAIYLESAPRLLEDAASAALARAGIAVADVDAVVAVSTTGVATPSLDALMMERMPFRRDVRRLPIFGLGCAGGVLGMARAATMADAFPGSNVLLLVIELCALWFRRDDVAKSNIVATALFGDGAAAAVFRADGNGPRITGSGEHTFAKSLDIMGWEVEDDGLAAIFSRDIPHLIETQLQPVLDAFLKTLYLTRADIDRFLAHPGGTKVLDALESAFGIPAGSLADSRAILQEYGNMSAVTLLFVIERALQRGALANGDWNRALLSAMGPGFTAGFVTLER